MRPAILNLKTKPSLILAVFAITILAACRKEVDSKANISTSAAAQVDDPGLSPVITYPLQYQALVTLSIPRGGLSSAGSGNKVFFAGGRNMLGNGTSTYYSTVDIFDVTNLSRTTSQLSQARYWLSGGSLGNKIFFAGGMSYFGHSNRVDIYDTESGSWTTSSLSQPRYLIAVTSTKTKIYFAGGITFNSQGSNVVDVYDAITGSWSSTTVKAIEGIMAGASAGSTTLFGGTDYDPSVPVTKAVVFNAIPFFQTTMPLTGHSDRDFSAVGIGDKIMFAGGYSYPPSKKVSIYNVQSKTWSTKDLSEGRLGIGTCTVDKFAVFAGGTKAEAGSSDKMDIYDNSTGNWHSLKMIKKYWPLSVASAEKKVFIANSAAYSPTGEVMVYRVTNPPPTLGQTIP